MAKKRRSQGFKREFAELDMTAMIDKIRYSL